VGRERLQRHASPAPPGSRRGGIRGSAAPGATLSSGLLVVRVERVRRRRNAARSGVDLVSNPDGPPSQFTERAPAPDDVWDLRYLTSPLRAPVRSESEPEPSCRPVRLRKPNSAPNSKVLGQHAEADGGVPAQRVSGEEDPGPHTPSR